MGGYAPDGVDYPICTFHWVEGQRGPRAVRSLALQGVFVGRMPIGPVNRIVESIWYDAFLDAQPDETEDFVMRVMQDARPERPATEDLWAFRPATAQLNENQDVWDISFAFLIAPLPAQTAVGPVVYFHNRECFVEVAELWCKYER